MRGQRRVDRPAPARLATRELATSFSLPETEHRGLGANFSVLAPPYVVLSHVSLDDPMGPSLGSAVFDGNATSPVAALARLTQAAHRWPWIIPCVVLPSTGRHLRGAIEIISELRDRLAVATVGDRAHTAGAPDIARAIARAIVRRAQPTAPILARWVAQRLEVRGLARVLRRQFADALEQVPSTAACSSSTYSRYFAALGRFRAHDWRRLARLCVDAPRHAHPLPRSPVSRRTTEAHVRRYLGMTFGEATRLVGWEWVLESALRRGGYLAASHGPVAPPPFALSPGRPEHQISG